MPKTPVLESSDGRLWLPVYSHPQTDHEVLVCRSLQASPDGSYAIKHTAVLSRSDLKITIFHYGT